MSRTSPEVVFEYCGVAEDGKSFVIALTCLSQDEHGFDAWISFRLPCWEARVRNYFLGWSLNRFMEEIDSMRTSPNQQASLLSFDEEVELLVSPSLGSRGIIAVSLLCGEDFKADCFRRDKAGDARKNARLVLDSGFVELDGSYLEALRRDIQAFLKGSTFSREHPSTGSAAK